MCGADPVRMHGVDRALRHRFVLRVDRVLHQRHSAPALDREQAGCAVSEHTRENDTRGAGSDDDEIVRRERLLNRLPFRVDPSMTCAR